MNDRNAPDAQSDHLLLIACATALAIVLTVSLPLFAHASELTPPPTPSNLRVPAGNKVFFVGHAVGTQNYICLPSGAGFKFTLVTPRATLFNDDDEEVTTHYFSPNPFVNGAIRATWQHSRDTSKVWGHAIEASSDPNFVAPGAIAWVLLQRFGVDDGPTGGEALTATTFVQRLNTKGGIAPSTGCNSPAEVGNQAFAPYTADYYFYTDQ